MQSRVFGIGIGVAGAMAGWALPLAAQDIELLGEYYGTRPPDAYYEVIQRNPEAFRFTIEGSERLERLRNSPILRQSAPGAATGPTALAIGPRDGPFDDLQSLGSAGLCNHHSAHVRSFRVVAGGPVTEAQLLTDAAGAEFVLIGERHPRGWRGAPALRCGCPAALA